MTTQAEETNVQKYSIILHIVEPAVFCTRPAYLPPKYIFYSLNIYTIEGEIFKCY